MSAKTYDKQTAAFLAKVAECMPPLPRSEMQVWIEHPHALQEKLQSALATTREASPPAALSRVWRTVELGVAPRDADGLRSALKDARCKVSEAADAIIGEPSFRVAPQPHRVNLVAASVADLGFQSGAKYLDIFKRGVQLGLQLCSSETGPQLRLQYLDQPKGEWVYLATETITDAFGDARSFTVAHTDEGLCLNSHGGFPGRRFKPKDVFVFVSRT